DEQLQGLGQLRALRPEQWARLELPVGAAGRRRAAAPGLAGARGAGARGARRGRPQRGGSGGRGPARPAGGPAQARGAGEVFWAIDANGDGHISGGVLRQQLAALEHPDVQAGRASAAEASKRLLGAWQGADPVSLPEFLDRHVLLSALWPGGDAEFENSVCRLWRVPQPGAPAAAARRRGASAPASRGPGPAQQAAAAQRWGVEERLMRSPRAALLVERVRLACQREGGRAMWPLVRALREMAAGGSLEVPEVVGALRQEAGVEASAADVTDVLRAVDRQGSGSVGVEELLQALRGPLRPPRAAAVHQAFCALDAGGCGTVPLSQLRRAFRPECLLGGRQLAHAPVRREDFATCSEYPA
ncbi:unnamed protein product, partial [Prorocentrum cordatum]